MPFQVLFHSLECTGSIPSSVSLYILHANALSSASISELNTFLRRYNRSASFVNATNLIPANLPIRSGDHVSPATFCRLFIAEILPDEIDLAVYLDADMLALRSIAPLFDESLHGLVAATDHCTPANQIRLWGERGGTYFQAGVLVIPLQVWREQEILGRFFDVMANEQERIQWWDQDVLNIALRDSWQRLPIWFNVCEGVHKDLPLSLIENHAVLIHYSGSKKPWNAYNPSPFTAHWDQVYEEAFGQPFNREALRPPRPPLRSRLQSAVRSRIAGLIHGRR